MQQFGVIVIQAGVDAEACPQGGGQQPRAGGGTDQGKRMQGQLHAACIRAGFYHDVDAEVFHGRIEVFFHHGAQPVNFINKKHILLFHVGQQAGQVPWFIQHRPGGYFNAHPHFVGNDMGQGGLAQPGWSVKQHVVEGFVALRGSSHEDLQVLHHFKLPGKTGEASGPEGLLNDALFIGKALRSRIQVFVH